MIRLTIIDGDVEREWLSDEFGVLTFTAWCEANGLPVTSLVSGSIEVLERDRSAVIRYATYEADPAGGWRSAGHGQPHVLRFEQDLVQRLPRNVRGRVLTEADPPPEANVAPPVSDEQLTL